MTRLMDAPVNSGNPSIDEWAQTIVRQVETAITSINNGKLQSGQPVVIPAATVAQLTGPNPVFSPFNTTTATYRLVGCSNATSAAGPVLCISGGTAWIRVDTNVPVS